MHNLLDNAVKYTEKGTVTVAVYKEGQNAVLKVSDTGIGIPADQLSRIFERFYVVDKSRSRKLGGTGLGLSISHQIVQDMGGSLTAENLHEPDRVRFTIALPASEPGSDLENIL